MNFMLSTATVAVRVRVTSLARMEPARSICDMIQPPKMSPLKLVSAGMGMVRRSISPCGPPFSGIVVIVAVPRWCLLV